ncbi:hypothetical protein KKH13_03600 [Patescibacteria group bacterium]|nr:hypothetical protein [Patescibacteria group bacterium]
MKKEVLIAIIAGLVLGLIITLGIYTANRSLSAQRTKKQLQNQPTPTAIPAEANAKSLNLTSHENYDLVDASDQTLNGVAWPNAVIGLISETESQFVKADEEGIFSLELQLVKGFNEITLIATDETEASQTLNLILTYSTSKIEPLTYALPGLIKSAHAAEASPAGETVTEKIKERLQDTVNEGLVSIKEQLTSKSTAPRKKAFMGKVTNLDESSLNLSYKEQDFAVNLHENTIYIKGTNTAIDREDLQVDDFVITMGFYDPKTEDFTAARVSLINEPEPAISRQLIKGKITEVDGQKVSFNSKSLTLTKNTDLKVNGLDEPATEDLALGDNLFAIVTLDSNGDIDKVDAVYILPGKNNPAGLTPTNVNATESAESSPPTQDGE